MRKFVREDKTKDKDIIEIYPAKTIQYQIRYGKKCNEEVKQLKQTNKINFTRLIDMGYKEIV